MHRPAAGVAEWRLIVPHLERLAAVAVEPQKRYEPINGGHSLRLKAPAADLASGDLGAAKVINSEHSLVLGVQRRFG